MGAADRLQSVMGSSVHPPVGRQVELAVATGLGSIAPCQNDLTRLIPYLLYKYCMYPIVSRLLDP